MTKRAQVYRCNVCGNMVEVLNPGAGTLVCCGKPMELLVEKTEDVGFEKHVPVIETTEEGIRVKVGSIPHPMEEKHYIQWIEVLAEGLVYRVFLTPGSKPEALFKIKAEGVTAREYCNLHGLWSSS